MMDIGSKTYFSTIMKKTPDDTVARVETAYTGLRYCYIIEGNVVWQINGENYSVEKGDIIFFSESQKRRITEYGADGFEVFVARLDRQAFKNPSHFSFYCDAVNKMNGVIKNEQLSLVAEEIYNEDKSDNADKYEFLSAKFTEFFIKAQRLYPEIGSKVYVDSQMAKIMDIIDTKAVSGITLTEAARLAGLSDSTFSRKFADYSGVSFKRYVMSKKIERAIYLLKNTDSKVIDVAFECGFNSISGFYDTFKKITGTTPDKISVAI